ncbi:MAG: hypothetical protein J0M04_15855 [Verrucomicrobia bacterium]|nr:hypothetical protein [Verrucomicrobiota bacterium]
MKGNTLTNGNTLTSSCGLAAGGRCLGKPVIATPGGEVPLFTATASFRWVLKLGFISFLLLAGCGLTTTKAPMTLAAGATADEAVKSGGAATVRFSYVRGGRKYDLATLDQATQPVVFENGRLFAMLPAGAINDWERMVENHVKSVDLPFEHGVEFCHAWVLEQRRSGIGATPAAEGNLAEAAASAVILAPIAPVLVAGGICAGAEYAMTGDDRARARQLNGYLLASGTSYREFLAHAGAVDFRTAKGPYEIREYLATKGSFFTGGTYYYEVGFDHGRPMWVTYQNSPVRFRAVNYASGKNSR